MKTKITFMAFIISALCFTSNAQIATWTGPAIGDWSTAANWSSSSMPLSTDSVSIPTGFVVTVSENVGTINRLSVSGKLIIGVAGILSVDQTANPNASAIVAIAGGEIENNGMLTMKNSVTTNSSNTVLQFSENVNFDNKFTNNGTFTLDNTLGAAYASTVGRGIGLSQLSPGRVSTLKMGGTMNFNIKPGCCLIESNGGGNLTIDGKVVIGAADNYKDLRFIKILNGGNVTIAPTAIITLFSGFTNASNGVINIQTATTVAPGSSFTNNGTVTIHGGDATTGYGIYFNPQTATAINTLNNNGTLVFDGKFPKGTFYLGGTAGATNTLNNALGATLSLSNTDVAAITLKSASATTLLAINNEGTMNLSSTAHNLLAGATFNGSGTINYSYVSGIKSITGFEGKIYSNGNTIIVNLPSNVEAQLILTDVAGRTLKTANLKAETNTLTTNNLKGIYIVRLLTAKGRYTQKISLY